MTFSLENVSVQYYYFPLDLISHISIQVSSYSSSSSSSSCGVGRCASGSEGWGVTLHPGMTSYRLWKPSRPYRPDGSLSKPRDAPGTNQSTEKQKSRNPTASHGSIKSRVSRLLVHGYAGSRAPPSPPLPVLAPTLLGQVPHPTHTPNQTCTTPYHRLPRLS